MIAARRTPLLCYSSAVIAILLATLVRLWLDPALGNQAPFATYYIATMVTAWYGGLGPSLVTLVCGALLGSYSFAAPPGAPLAPDLGHQVGLGLYLCVGSVVALLTESLRKQAEAALHLTQFSVDRASDPIFWLGPDARFVYANFRASACLGYSREELRALALHDIDANCSAEAWPRHWEELKRRGAFTYESQYRRKDGSLVPVEISANYVELGGKQYNCAFVRDITERKRAEEPLHQERNLLRALIDNLPDCIYVKDTQGRFLAANLAVARMMGAATPCELLGKTDADFYPAGRAAEYRRDEQELLRSGQPLINKDEPHLDSAGNLCAVWTTKVPFRDSHGEIVGLVGISRDITERQRAEEEYRQAQQQVLDFQQREKELVQAELSKARDVLVRQTRLAAVGQLSASIAHELRNPLAAIGNAAFLLGRKLPQHEPKWREYLEMICSQVQAAHAIITDCMAMSRGTPPAKNPVPLAALITKLKSQVDTANQVHWHCAPESDPFWIYADATQFEQVLRNLVVNSIQSLGGSGTIRIDAAHCGTFDKICVSDDGPGIPPQVRDQIFEPLVTAKPQGTGLGLTICRQIIEQHGGTVELLDLPGPGAAFQIQLPHATGGPPAAAITSIHSGRGGAGSTAGTAS